ncbi:amino acid permease, partial [candidate division KSB1 bacterium]|nr:amino acid permease [candidate division KSB1 bacterium]
GVFITLPLVARESGSPLIAALAWLIGGLLWVPQIFILSEMATAYPEQGFGYLYLKKAGSPLLAFLYVWTVFITSDTPSISIIALIAISSLASILPALSDPWLSRGLAVLLIIILTIPHYRDVRQGGNLQIVLTIAKLSPLLLLMIIGFFHFSSGHLTAVVPTFSRGWTALLLAGVSATVWSYAGFPNLLYMAGEVSKPQVTLPRAMLISVFSVTAAYVLIALATSAIMPHHTLIAISGTFANPFAYLPAWAGFAGAFLAVAAFISMLGALNGCIMVQPRLEYAIARDGLFFKPFAHVHRIYRTPDYSLLIQSGLAILITLFGGIESLLGYFTLSYIVQNGLVYGAIFWLRRKDDYRPSYRAPWWAFMGVLAILTQLFLAYGTFLAYSAGGVLAALVLILTGLPVYFYFRRQHG